VIVVDANIIAYFYLDFGTPQTQLAESLMRRDCEWVAPRLWRSEFRSILAKYLRGGQLSLPQAVDMMAAAESIVGAAEYEPPSVVVLRLAQQSGCSTYDCEYVALARDLKVPLLTADQAVLRQFPTLAVSMAAFLAQG
jgi:predicted nucleic acid-binding protein